MADKLTETKEFIEYEKAIEGRNFHYQNYNTWMNLYAIFNGALFIGLYSSIKQESIFYSSVLGVYEGTTFSPKFLSIIIIICGFVASMCWLLSLNGYYSWMRSWIRIVQTKEEQLNFSVYRKYYGEKVKEADTLKKDYFSTQKISQVFVSVVILAWALVPFFSVL